MMMIFLESTYFPNFKTIKISTKNYKDLSEEDTDPDRNRGIIVLCRKCLIRSSQHNEMFTIMSRNFKYEEAGLMVVVYKEQC